MPVRKAVLRANTVQELTSLFVAHLIKNFNNTCDGSRGRWVGQGCRIIVDNQLMALILPYDVFMNIRFHHAKDSVAMKSGGH